MELRVADAQNVFTAERAAQSVDYWRTTAQQLLADSETPADSAARKAYSKLVSEQAALCDRMDTDVVSGLEAGMHTVLVLTGITQRAEAERFPYRPSRIVDSIADLIDELGA